MNKSQLTELLEPTVSSLGYVLWGCEYLSQGKHSVLRLYIDKDEGVGLEDCETVSRQISEILDVEDPIQGNYSLEISSPGLDRPLFDTWQYEKYIGHAVVLKLHQAINKRKKITGVINFVSEHDLVLKLDTEDQTIPFEMISKANLVS